MIDFTTVLQPKYWFDLTPSPMSGISEKVLLAFFGIIFIAGLVLRAMERRKKIERFLARAVHRAARVGLTMGALGILFLFFSFEQARLFGARFWYLFWLIGFLVWLGFILHEYFRVAPREKKIEELRRQREKYLPRKK